MSSIRTIFILFILLVTCLSCDDYTKSKELRFQKSAESGDEIVIAAVGSMNNKNLFLEGIQLAAKQINSRKSFMGRSVRILTYDMMHSVNKAKEIAYKIGRNSNVMAVIGYPASSAAIPASITFEQSGILFLSTGATHNAFTQKGGLFTFRITPSNKFIAHQMALFARRNGYIRLISFIDLGSYQQDLANVFLEEAIKNGLQIVDQKTYFGWQKNFKSKLSDLQNNDSFDAIFLNGDLPGAAEIIKQARQMGIKKKFLGGFSLDSPELWEIAGKHSVDTIVPCVFDPKYTCSKVINFVKDFQKEYGVQPDTWAALGYDALQALEQAVRKSSSIVPIDIATSMRLIDDFNGVTGTYSFLSDKKMPDQPLFFKIAHENNFKFLERERHSKINLNDVVEDITLRLPMNGDVSTIDPGLLIEQNSIEIVEQLFLGLTDFSKDKYLPTPELAKNWVVSADGLNYTFFLRDDVVWTDGTQVTAYDIEWAIKRNIDPKNKAPYSSYLYVLKNARNINLSIIKDIDSLGVKAVDNFKIKFSLEHSAAYFPSLSGLPVFRPVPRHIIEKYGDRWTDIENIVTNGSYKLVAWDKGRVIILRKNPDYYEYKKVSIPEIRYTIISDSSLGLLLYHYNKIDIMGNVFLKIPLSDLSLIRSNPKMDVQYKEVPLFSINALFFNTINPPLDNTLLRKAIVAAIDRDLIIKMIAKGNFNKAKTISIPQNKDERIYLNDVGINFSPLNAKKWLAQAGYPDGNGLNNIHLVINESKINYKIAMAIKECLLFYLNINIIVHNLTWDEYSEILTNPGMNSNKWHIARIAFYADYPDPNNWLNDLFNPFASHNIVGWNNYEYADIMDAASREIDHKKRKSLYKRAEEILCNEECVTAPLFYEMGNYLVNPRVKGWYNMAIGGQHIRNWSLEVKD
ncbi:MAG: ABC transporter substrate-binding protein [Candidatus Magnetomorum sp.]|nr:ABC transporter substrate-binding protein [Candidatus Magnetomorum sp.]